MEWAHPSVRPGRSMAQYGRRRGKREDGRKEGRQEGAGNSQSHSSMLMDGVRPPNREGEITPAGTPLVNIFQTIRKKLSGNFLFSPLPMSFSHFPSGARRFPPPLSASPLHGKALSGLIDWPTASATVSGSFPCKSTQTERAGQVSERKRVLGGCDAQLRHYGIY